jgi:hypothetical protein
MVDIAVSTLPLTQVYSDMAAQPAAMAGEVLTKAVLLV